MSNFQVKSIVENKSHGIFVGIGWEGGVNYFFLDGLEFNRNISFHICQRKKKLMNAYSNGLYVFYKSNFTFCE